MMRRHRWNPTRLLLPCIALGTGLGLSACGGGGGSSPATPVVNATPYTIGGAVSGLTGSGLVLQDNGGNNLGVSGNGTFAFTTAIASGSAYGVTVLTQPSTPAQTCAVAAASGTVTSANVTNVQVICTTNTYTIGGAVSGLAGSGLVLQDNGGNNLGVSGNGNFTFTAGVASGSAFGVTVLTQPATPAQTCAVSGGSGTVSTANVTSVQVACTTSNVSNVVALTVNAGPAAASGGTFNVAYASVTLCQPGTKTCATINNVQVDTGSEGLRIMASALAAAGLTLTNMADPNNSANTIAECVPFADGYTWGVLAAADVSMGGELASGASINIIDDNASYAPAAPSSCTSNGMSLNSIMTLGANGELGVGVFDQDCGTACANCSLGGTCNGNNDFYYSCGSSANSCTFSPLALTSQVRNPVALFATDNNGVILQLPAIAASGARTATGSLIFGIGTQSNNGLGSATVLTADNSGNFTTTFNGQTLSGSFIDSGSNGFYFPDSSIPTCSDAKDFYCPTSTLALSATNQGQNGNTSTVSFQIANLDNISQNDYAIDDVGGPTVSISGLGTGYFDWGLPFMYGRSVFTAIEGKRAGSATGPYYAY